MDNEGELALKGLLTRIVRRASQLILLAHHRRLSRTSLLRWSERQNHGKFSSLRLM